MDIKKQLKKLSIARYINERIKSYTVKHEYEKLCQKYGTPSILKKPTIISLLGKEQWEKLKEAKFCNDWRPKVLFVGTDWEQDRSGIIQGLSNVADLTLFEDHDGAYGQMRPTSKTEMDTVRYRNGKRLLSYLGTSGRDKSFDVIVGQMWGFKMYWSAIKEARKRGTHVVNIAMDDRHSFVGRRLADGTFGGTMGLAPYLSLACTDAPECVKWYEAEGCKAIYLPEASDPDIFRPIPGPKVHDVCFVGANYGIRAKLVSAIEKAGIKVQAYGNGWLNGRIPTDDVPELFARSKIVLGCGTIGFCDDFLALKLRDFDGPMSGSLYMTHDNSDLYPLFDVGKEIITFRNIPDAVQKIKYFLNNPEKRKNIASAGRWRAVKSHTWEKRFKLILAKLKY